MNPCEYSLSRSQAFSSRSGKTPDSVWKLPRWHETKVRFLLLLIVSIGQFAVPRWENAHLVSISFLISKVAKWNIWLQIQKDQLQRERLISNQQEESSVSKGHKAYAVEIPIMMWTAKSCDESLNLGGVREGKKLKRNLAAAFSIQFTTHITKTRHLSSS